MPSPLVYRSLRLDLHELRARSHPNSAMAGVAVDYTGAASARAHLQARTNAAALQVAKRAPTAEEAQKLVDYNIMIFIELGFS